MAITEAQVLSVLSQVKDPELGRDVVSLDMIKDLTIKDDARRPEAGPHHAGLSRAGGVSAVGPRCRRRHCGCR